MAPAETETGGGERPADKPNPKALKARCLHLGEEVNAFSVSRSGFPGDATEEYIRRHDEETVRRYHDLHKPGVMDLYAQLAPEHWFNEADRKLFENLSDWSQLEEVAARLKTVGERLPDR